MKHGIAQDGDSNNSVLSYLATQIAEHQWQKMLRENPNKYSCAVCQKSATLQLSIALKLLPEANSWRVHLTPTLPLCKNQKCFIVASRFVEKFTISTTRIVKMCANCSNGYVEELFCCSRCKTETYCSVDCQKAHWPEHKKACKLVTCQRCGKLETAKFPKCVKCQTVFYCGRDCQLADWADHKKACKKKN
jgi:hypothetical protein